MNIGRTLFWFQDGDEQLVSINGDFFGISTMLNRLLNETYNGKKIKFINLDFFTIKTYELHPKIPKDTPYHYGGHLKYSGFFCLSHFIDLNWNEKKHYVWEKACNYIKIAAEFTKNNELLDAIEYASLKGIQNNLNPDYSIFNLNIIVNNQQIKASLWINFKEDGMYSNLVIENEAGVINEKQIDKTHKGIEFFLEMYSALEFDGTFIIIKGARDVDYLPMKLPISDFI